MGASSERARQASEKKALEEATEYVLEILLEQEPIPEKDEEGEPIDKEAYIDEMRVEISGNLESDPYYYEDLLNEYEGLTYEQRLAM
jgi:hypothetical protein